jgi:hypothetical protein
MNHKLFCTFSSVEDVESKLLQIKNKYTVMYGNIFILEIKNQNEYILTYNLDSVNLTEFPVDTILVHRKKETNTLYTINAINEVIKMYNGGYLDKRYELPWHEFRNTLLLTKDNQLRKLQTSLVQIEKI